jgi:DNA-binding CsgD family transcriptional regulator
MVAQFVRDDAGNAWLPGLMLVCAELGMREEARRGFQRLAEHDFGSIPRDEMFVTCLVYCAETCCRLGDRERAAALYSLLSPHAGGTANHPRAVCFGSTDLFLAMLAALRGDTERARTHFETAIEMNRAMQAWPWLARTLFRYGLFLRGLDSPADLARARSVLAGAEQLAAQLGMAALVGEIGSVQSSESGAFPDQLTAREVEVLRLLAIGRTNKDISAVLAISLNTVATHVRSILEKTGAANRTEAAAYAIRMGLREPS